MSPSPVAVCKGHVAYSLELAINALFTLHAARLPLAPFLHPSLHPCTPNGLAAPHLRSSKRSTHLHSRALASHTSHRLPTLLPLLFEPRLKRKSNSFFFLFFFSKWLASRLVSSGPSLHSLHSSVMNIVRCDAMRWDTITRCTDSQGKSSISSLLRRFCSLLRLCIRITCLVHV